MTLTPALHKEIEAVRPKDGRNYALAPLTKVQVVDGDPWNGKPVMVAVGQQRVLQDPHLNVKVGQGLLLYGERRLAFCAVVQKIHDTDSDTLIYTLEKQKLHQIPSGVNLNLDFTIDADGNQQFESQTITFAQPPANDPETDGVDIEGDLK